MGRDYWVYILTNRSHAVFYVGVTHDVQVRYYQHLYKEDANSFTAKYNLNKLVYMEHYQYIENAIFREKRLKRWNRKWKLDLIKSINPNFVNLMEDLRDDVVDMYVTDEKEDYN